jgi:hypothetical protein
MHKLRHALRVWSKSSQCRKTWSVFTSTFQHPSPTTALSLQLTQADCSRHRETLYSHQRRSQQAHRPRQRKGQSPHRLPEPPIRLRLPHPTAPPEPQPVALRQDHRVRKPLRRRPARMGEEMGVARPHPRRGHDVRTRYPFA